MINVKFSFRKHLSITSNAPLPKGRTNNKCGYCGNSLKATTILHADSNEDDPTIFCPNCGWDESK